MDKPLRGITHNGTRLAKPFSDFLKPMPPREKTKDFLGKLLAAALFLGAAYWVWPEGIEKIPLAQLTLEKIGSAVFAVVLAMIGLSAFKE